MLAGPEAYVLFRDREQWRDLEGLLKREEEKKKKKKSPKRCSSPRRVTAHRTRKTGIKSCCVATVQMTF